MGHADIFAWSDLISDRSRKPAVTRRLRHACGWRSGPNFENFDLFHAQSPNRAWCSRSFVAGEPGC